MNVIQFIESHEQQYLEELKEFLRIPSVSTRNEYKPEIERAVRWLAEKLRCAGMQGVEVNTNGDASPRVCADKTSARRNDDSCLWALRCAAGRTA
jgi:acetylornithine deacetylase/succinyl-diaminopimelate desuccinylase-like protein